MSFKFHDITRKTAADNNDVKKDLQKYKGKCLTAASEGKSEIKFELTSLNFTEVTALKLLADELPVSSYHEHFTVFRLV